ncbi:MAG: hypothetical protein K6T29_09520, partial [Peptococcaceae bacterium]|nr:hypothetical protein [Peptococcaceae bacterium]
VPGEARMTGLRRETSGKPGWLIVHKKNANEMQVYEYQLNLRRLCSAASPVRSEPWYCRCEAPE